MVSSARPPKAPPNPRHTGLYSSQDTGRLSSLEIDANDFDVGNHLELRSNTADSESDPKPNQDDIKKAGQFAEMFVDTKRSFMADNNILDSNKTVDAYGTTLQEDPKMAHISRATLVRAEKVKATLGFKYLMIERLYDKSVVYPGIDGVYNPLQIMRNRKIRAKYKEFPKPLSIKALPLASTVFSVHNQRGSHKKQWKLPWALELNELLSDRAWRAHHIHELRNPKGELWYPPSSNSSVISKQKGSRHENMKKRLHDKLFNEDDMESEKSSKSNKSNRSGGARPDELRMLSLTENTKGRRDRIKSKVKKIKNGTDSEPSSDIDSVHSKGDDDTKLDSSEPPPFPIIREPTDQSLPLLKIPLSDGELAGLNNIQIKSINKSKNTLALEFEDPGEENHSPVDDGEKPEDIQLRRELNIQLVETYNSLDYFDRTNNLKLHYLVNIYPDLTNSNIEKINQLVYTQIPNLNQLMVDINDDSIPSYELLCSTILNEIKSLIHILNDDYSLKIDNLLTSSDRLIGEINTSMSLELRKVDERLDKLNHSLFGPSFVSHTMASPQNQQNLQNLHPQTPSFILSDSGNYKVLYFLLENGIVITLRLIWMVVNIYKFGLWILHAIWKIIKFILF